MHKLKKVRTRARAGTAIIRPYRSRVSFRVFRNGLQGGCCARGAPVCPYDCYARFGAPCPCRTDVNHRCAVRTAAAHFDDEQKSIVDVSFPVRGLLSFPPQARRMRKTSRPGPGTVLSTSGVRITYTGSNNIRM